MATTVLDEEAVDVGTNPTLYANQPANKLLCRLAYAGSEDASAFTIGGTLAAYVKIVKPAADTAEYGTNFAATEFWLAATATRLPDSLAGTGSTITVDGPPGLTTLNPTIISSQGRPTDPVQALALYGSSVFAQLPTEDWLRFKLAKDRSDSLFQPVAADAPFPGGTFFADKPSSVATIMAGLAVGGKYRIVLRNIGDAAWDNTSVTWSTAGSAKDFTTGGGYVVIEPDTVSPPILKGRYFITHQWEGVHIRNLLWPGAPAKINGVATGRDGFCLSCSATNAQVILENIEFTDPDWVQDVSANGIKVFVQVSNAKCFRILRCKFKGGKRNITFTNVWLSEVDYADVGQTQDDFCDPAMDCKHINRWPSDDLIMILHGSRVCNVYDRITGLHLDVAQYSTSITYPGGITGPDTINNTYPAKAVAVGDFRIVGSHVYKCTIPGTTPFRSDIANPVPPLPSHTSGTALDGTDPATNPTFEYWGEVANLPRQYVIVYGLVVMTGGSVKKSTGNDHPAAQFLINSHGGPMPMLVFNNFVLTTEVLGLGIHCRYQTERNYFSFNSLLGPAEHPVGGFYFNQGIQNAPSALNPGKCRAYKNITANLDTDLFAEGNIVVRGKSPGAGLAYWDKLRCAQSDFFELGDGAWRFAFQDDNQDAIEDSIDRVSKLFHSLDRRIGARGRETFPLQVRVIDANGQASNIITAAPSFDG